jgi:hypothetical protein
MLLHMVQCTYTDYNFSKLQHARHSEPLHATKCQHKKAKMQQKTSEDEPAPLLQHKAAEHHTCVRHFLLTAPPCHRLSQLCSVCLQRQHPLALHTTLFHAQEVKSITARTHARQNTALSYPSSSGQATAAACRLQYDQPALSSSDKLRLGSSMSSSCRWL